MAESTVGTMNEMSTTARSIAFAWQVLVRRRREIEANREFEAVLATMV